ncbi:MAG: hypothetical protein GQ570_00375 [Helicobacteraceae bacterium]|nr:hypothetical protein [Helicobacteraceae bacterium]
MKQQDLNIPLHDIKPLVEVPDQSLYILIALVVVGLVVLIFLAIWIYNYFTRVKKLNIRKRDFEALQNIDFSDPKAAAYDISKYGLTFSNDSEQLQQKYQNLSEQLSAYKYKKDVEVIDEKVKAYFEIYKGMIDV